MATTIMGTTGRLPYGWTYSTTQCWWLIDGVLCNKRMALAFTSLSYRCTNGHETTYEEFQERKYYCEEVKQ